MQTQSQPGSDGGILIVDDHQMSVRLLRELLAREFPEQSLRSASSAEAALAICRSALPRLVILDIGLPGINGIDAARRIKALSPEVRVVMHTNYDQVVYRERSAAAGADDFVSKTQTHAALTPAIARLLAQQAEPPAVR